MKIYPPTYVPEVKTEKPTVTAKRRVEMVDSIKAHMKENRGYLIKELIDFVQAELIAENIHVRDKDVKVWLLDLNDKWGWKPPVSVDVISER